MDEIQLDFIDQLSEHAISLTEIQLEQFEAYYRELVDWNERMNLTAITDRADVYEKHFFDSLTLGFHVDLSNIATIADIGSGAGFPSIPLKIVFPDLKVTIVDSLQKRITFLQHLASVLRLEGVDFVHGRAEEVGRDPSYRDSFDLVTARAVARLAVLNEFCLPFVKKGGLFAAMKGSQAKEELQEATASLTVLKGKLQKNVSLRLPKEDAERHIIVVEKVDSTPKAYPRKPGVPAKSPII